MGQFDGTQIGPDGQRHPIEDIEGGDVPDEAVSAANKGSFDMSLYLGFAQDTDLAASSPLPSIPAGVTKAEVAVSAQAVRWRTGTAPTASVGMPLAAGTTKVFTGDATTLGALRFIEVTAGASISVTYWR